VDADFADFDFEVLEADARSPDQVLAAAGMVPFGSPVRLVILRGVELYRKRERSGDAERLAAGIAALGEGSCLVLRVGAAEDEKSRGKTVLTQKLDRAIGEAGVMVQCRALSDEDLAGWVGAEAARAGKRIEPAAARHVVATGRGLRSAIANELEKAICYAGDQPVVTLAMAQATASYDPEDVMFKLVDAIVRRNADAALLLFHEILRYDPKPQAVAGKLLALLARQLRLIAQANELNRLRIDPGSVRNLPPDVASELPQEGSIVAMAWKARDIYAQGRGWSGDLMASAFGWMMECDLNNKGGGEGSEDVVTNVELLILRLCGVK
jgi:DNA polymerase-3 subunit delta